MKSYWMTASFILAGLAAFTPAQAQPEKLCSGHVALLQISEISPQGSMAGFNKAVADHIKWYADHGYTDKIFAEPTLTFNLPKGRFEAIPNEMMIFHLNAQYVPESKKDAAWNAYVKEYSDNSTTKSTTAVCYPD